MEMDKCDIWSISGLSIGPEAGWMYSSARKDEGANERKRDVWRRVDGWIEAVGWTG